MNEHVAEPFRSIVNTMSEIPKNEALLMLMSLDLSTLRDEMGKISGSWNGKDEQFSVEGTIYDEDAAHCADEIVGACNKLEELLEEMSHYGKYLGQ